MRTAIFFGLVLVADAIYRSQQLSGYYTENVLRNLICPIIGVIMVMDITDFFVKLSKQSK